MVEWQKINLRAKNKNLPEVGKIVLWATNSGANNKNCFFKFLGALSDDCKYVDSLFNRYKLTSNFWWVDVNDPRL